jgi:hypothetical protein
LEDRAPDIQRLVTGKTQGGLRHQAERNLMSRENAADDELITIAYTFKTLTDDERRAVYQALKDQPAGSAFNADIGTKLPPGIELRPVPDEVAARVPQTWNYRYAVAKDRVLLVGTGRIVVGVFADVPVSEGHRER